MRRDEERARRQTRERLELQRRLSRWLDLPMAVLAVVWTLLLVVEWAFPESPVVGTLGRLDLAIWALFVAQFAVELLVAPGKLHYLHTHWLTALSVALPTLRAFRIVAGLRALRSVSLVSLLLRANLATRAVGIVFRERRFGYLIALVALVALTGAAGIAFFEQAAPDSPLRSFWEALWWSTAMVTTINASAEPVTTEGRIISLLLRVFAMATFGYVAGSIASYFISEELPTGDGREEELRELRARLEALQRLIERLQATLDEQGRDRAG